MIEHRHDPTKALGPRVHLTGQSIQTTENGSGVFRQQFPYAPLHVLVSGFEHRISSKHVVVSIGMIIKDELVPLNRDDFSDQPRLRAQS
jgi:hypothetical protein